MEYYEDDEYIGRKSPGLEPVIVRMEAPTSPPYTPLWLPEDVYGVLLEQGSWHDEGLIARKKIYAQYKGKRKHKLRGPNKNFMDAVLLHHLHPSRPDLSFGLAQYMDLSDSDKYPSSDEYSDLGADSDDADSGANLDRDFGSRKEPPLLQPTQFLRPEELSDSPFAADKPGPDVHEAMLSTSIISPETLPPRRTSTRRLMTRQSRKTHLGLPITLCKNDVAATVLACADTGAEVNIMSDELARSLGYTDYGEVSQRLTFELANGSTVESIGRVSAFCSFGVDKDWKTVMLCIFHIFSRAASPIIMGHAFLEATKTMTEHRDRLVRVPRPNFQALSICSVNRPRQLLRCELNRKPILATLDSGSDIDVISLSFAKEQGFTVHPEEHIVELADGSLATLSGFVHLTLSVPKSTNITKVTHNHTETDFFVMEGLVHDVVVGEDIQTDLDVFGEHQHAIIPVSMITQSGTPGINRIRYLGAMDGLLAWVTKKISRQRNSSDDEAMSNICDDQRENARRESEARRIAGLPLDEQEAAIQAEQLRQTGYDQLPRGSKCDDPRCDATPGSESQLFKNCRDQYRSHLCQIKGCPRSAYGFWTKDDLRRHQVVVHPLKLACHFCPSRGRLYYPKKDNLARHVRVCHPEIHKDDPRLQDAMMRPVQVGI